MTVKKTPLYEKHLEQKAKMIEFGGWLMPVEYQGIVAEHKAVREKAGLFDVSHMGEFLVAGKDSFDFIQKMVTNDLSLMQANQVQYSPMCYPNGTTVDDLLIYKYDDQKYLLVVNASNIEKDWQWLNEHKGDLSVKLKDLSNDIALIAIQGPIAEHIVGKLTDADVGNLQYYRFYPEIKLANCTVIISRTGYTGEDGFEIYCKVQDAPILWDELLKAGSQEGLQPAGLGARDTLRFEACLPLYGHELSDTITPVQAGIGMFVKVNKEDFIGKKALAEQKQNGVDKKIIGFEMIDRGIARADYLVYADDKCIGKVTTGSVSPTIGKNLGLALVDKNYAVVDQNIFIEIRGKKLAAKVIAKPFYKKERK